MHALALLACTDRLVSELIVGVDIAADTTIGGPNDRLGASVAIDDVVAVAAPGPGTVIEGGVVTEGPSSWVGYLDGQLVRGGAEALWIGDAEFEATGARAYAVGLDEVFVATAGVLYSYPSGAVLFEGKLTGVAVLDGEPILRLDTAAGCVIRALDSATEFDLPCAAEGALAVEAGALCAGDPQVEDDEGLGVVGCEDGSTWVGERGDHLGRAIGGGYAMGSFNKWLVPARARAVPLGDGPVLALELGAENQPHALAGDGTSLVIGAPYYPASGLPSGAAFVVELP